MILVSLLQLELLPFPRFAAAVDWLPFVEYWVRVDFWFSLRDKFWTPLMIAAMCRFCSELYFLVVTEAVELMVLLFLLCHSFTGCALSGSSSIRCWVSHMSHNHYSLSYHLVVLLVSTPFSVWFPFPFPCLLHPTGPPLPWNPMT